MKFAQPNQESTEAGLEERFVRPVSRVIVSAFGGSRFAVMVFRVMRVLLLAMGIAPRPRAPRRTPK